MTATEHNFEARMVLTDATAGGVESATKNLARLRKEAQSTGGAMERHLHHPHLFAALTEHVDLLHDRFGELRGSIGEVGSGLTELLPAFAAFGAIGGLSALFETTEHAAESFAQLKHSAEIIGVTATALHHLDYAATLTDTSTERLHMGLAKLNRVMFDAGAGRNKQAASIFRYLHINPKDYPNSADILTHLADGFANQKGKKADKVREAMADALFGGRSGRDLIPFLLRGSAGIGALLTEAAKVQFDPDEKQQENLERYATSMKQLHAATEGFTGELGADLAPIFEPIVNHAKDWVVGHRKQISDFTTARLATVERWFDDGGFDKAEKRIERIGRDVDDVVERFGGWQLAVEALGASLLLRGGLFVLKPAIELANFTIASGKFLLRLAEMAAGWAGVGTAATEAAAAETAAATAGGGGGLAAKAVGGAAAAAEGAGGLFAAASAPLAVLPLGVAATAGAAYFLVPKMAHALGYHDGDTRAGSQAAMAGFVAGVGQDILERRHYVARGGHQAADFLAAPFAGSSPGDPMKVNTDGHVQVDINLRGAPSGTTAVVRSSGRVGMSNIKLGKAWPDDYQ